MDKYLHQKECNIGLLSSIQQEACSTSIFKIFNKKHEPPYV